MPLSLTGRTTYSRLRRSLSPLIPPEFINIFRRIAHSRILTVMIFAYLAITQQIYASGYP
ncbi:putative membrane protein (plasmid) [Erwinia amylovora LA635]|uniref:Putative membrane protein n=1 Tax=Erwinia amylovora TaxID=552 RepID=A0A0P0ZGR5_ERWAM|nr:putative membrane protein [Erwinia amylovora LA635]CDK23816.1 hypothetical protein LA636_p1038 [Erwinia amylovora LA636]CDK23866.1 hypothetical protein LA637_p1039 [Erwinia amylovora LA637]CDM08164.1 putative membrane protein [Erwinia amylovora]